MVLPISCVGGREDVTIILGLIAMQLIYGSFSVFMGGVLASGLSPLFVVIFGSLVTAIVISPVAFFFEKAKRPSKLSPRLCIQILCSSIGGVTVFQSLLFLGIEKASPPIASAMLNTIPGVVFAIAWCIGMEVVDVRCRYSWAKIVGTLVCLGGAAAMGFLRGPPISDVFGSPVKLSAADTPHENMLLGCMYLFAAVFLLSSVLILQAAILMQYPAPLSLCAITYWLGSVFTVFLHLVQEGGFNMRSSKLSCGALLGIAVMGGFVNAMTSFQSWSMKKKGPVMVAMFGPISAIASAILSSFILGDSLHLGSLIGMVLVFIGLYLVLWGKKKEGYTFPEGFEGYLLEKQEETGPLLS